MRGTRSLGYGFVTYSSEAEAHKAVELLNKKEIAGREINVEGAKPQAAAPAEKPAAAAAGEADKDGAAARGASTRGRGRGRGRGGRGGVSACCMLTFSSAGLCLRPLQATAARRPRADEGEEGLDEATDAAAAPAAAAENGEAAATKPKKNRKSKAAKATANGDAAPAADGATAAPAAAKPPKPQRAKGEAPVGAPSKTLLFVANLPFEFTDEQFKAVFEGGPEVVSAKVVKRPYSNKTKGFGFVDFKDEEGQQSALSNFNGKNVEGRDIVLKGACGALRACASADLSHLQSRSRARSRRLRLRPSSPRWRVARCRSLRLMRPPSRPSKSCMLSTHARGAWQPSQGRATSQWATLPSLGGVGDLLHETSRLLNDVSLTPSRRRTQLFPHSNDPSTFAHLSSLSLHASRTPHPHTRPTHTHMARFCHELTLFTGLAVRRARLGREARGR
jgi:RNA recognition motif-containing protein